MALASPKLMLGRWLADDMATRAEHLFDDQACFEATPRAVCGAHPVSPRGQATFHIVELTDRLAALSCARCAALLGAAELGRAPRGRAALDELE